MDSDQNFLLQVVRDNFPAGISVLDSELRVIFANGTMRRLLDLPDSLFADGAPLLEEIFRFNARRGEYGSGDVEQHVAARIALVKARKPHEFERRRPDGTVIEIRSVPVEGGGFVTTYLDITERRHSEARIAHHDALTGLPNRVLFRERLQGTLNRDQRDGRGPAVLLLDLDGFKNVNDTLGHAIGDVLLVTVAHRLLDCVRAGDTVARLGGDEFAIVQRVTDAPTEAAALAMRVREVIGAPIELDGHRLVIGTSIGIVTAPGDGTGPDQLLKNAGLALYRAKQEGGGIYRFFEPEMDQRMRARHSLERDLRHARLNGEFRLHYQASVNIERNEITGFEALLRWTHPERGNVPPADFIPLAEETGLIIPIGDWVLRQACADASNWPSQLSVAVNLSPVQLKSLTLVASVFNALTAARIAPERLELEVTESVTLQDGEATLATLHRLHGLGVRIALDDFGTGYSSLSNFRKFPFDKIKIDRSFVSDLSRANVDALAMVRSIARLGVALEMTTTAEGVETQVQLETVRMEGCTEMQGFLFSRPIPANEIAELLSKHRIMCIGSAQ